MRGAAARLTVDVFIPMSKVDDFFAWYEERLRHFPLSCVPYRRVRVYERLSPRIYRGLPDTLFLDLAIYGLKQPAGDADHYRLIEDELTQLGGVKTLISRSCYSEADFRRTWNRDNYLAAKAITDPRNLFGDLYTKTCNE